MTIKSQRIHLFPGTTVTLKMVLVEFIAKLKGVVLWILLGLRLQILLFTSSPIMHLLYNSTMFRSFHSNSH